MTQSSGAISECQMSGFISEHRLPPAFGRIAEQHFLPLAKALPNIRKRGAPLLLGINGAQGTGKSTLADFLRLATTSMFNWNVAVLSIDDFYYTLTERQTLAAQVHPLLSTRGVPGTHDTAMLTNCLDKLRRARSEDSVSLPRFDKATDDRADESQWPVIKGPVDLVILEGWCVGSKAQSEKDLAQPANALERDEDADGTWRHYVNDHLRTSYEPIFAQLDLLIFLGAPGFDAIFRWRLEQEEKLSDAAPSGSSGLMNRKQLARFVQFYERLTRANLATLPNRADIVIQLDDAHSVSSFTSRPGKNSQPVGT